jgi:hypothetical protein
VCVCVCGVQVCMRSICVFECLYVMCRFVGV